MLVSAAFVPSTPLLVPEIAPRAPRTDDVRAAARAAVERMLAAEPDRVVVVGDAPARGWATGSWDWRGLGVDEPPTPLGNPLPLALGIGDWLLDQATGRPSARTFYGVNTELAPPDCLAAGRSLSECSRTGLLLVADGSACRDDSAPGYFHPDAAAWDDQAMTALRGADTDGLASLDPERAQQVHATGRAVWQVLAGAATADGSWFQAEVDYAAAPYGVTYVAGTWTRAQQTPPLQRRP